MEERDVIAQEHDECIIVIPDSPPMTPTTLPSSNKSKSPEASIVDSRLTSKDHNEKIALLICKVIDKVARPSHLGHTNSAMQLFLPYRADPILLEAAPRRRSIEGAPFPLTGNFLQDTSRRENRSQMRGLSSLVLVPFTPPPSGTALAPSHTRHAPPHNSAAHARIFPPAFTRHRPHLIETLDQPHKP